MRRYIAFTAVAVLVTAIVGNSGTLAQEKQERQENQESQELTADDVIEDYLEAVGGEMTLVGRDVETIKGKLEADFINNAVKFQGDLTVQTKAGKLVIGTQITTPGMTKSIVGFDGEQYWMVDPATGLRRRATADEYSFCLAVVVSPKLVLLWKDQASEIKVVPNEKFDEQDVHEIQLTYPDCPVMSHYFDVESGLLVGSKYKSNTGDMVISYEHSDVEEVLCIVKILLKSNNGGFDLDYVFEFSEFDYETEIDDAVFAGPEK